MKTDSRVLVHFSCGASSAVAAKIAVERYKDERPVEVIYFDMRKDEHEDNQRFLADVERWIGQPIKLLHGKYQLCFDAWRGEKYIVGAFGAACTRTMKREVGNAYSKPDDIHVIGFTADKKELGRIADLEANQPDLKFAWVLASVGITKQDCLGILQSVGIELPYLYKLGFDHNNCIGCVKGGKGYWNKVRKHFPEKFASVAAIQREFGVGFRSGDSYFFLDTLRPDEGNDVPEPPIECGMFCSQYSRLIDMSVSALQTADRGNHV